MSKRSRVLALSAAAAVMAAGGAAAAVTLPDNAAEPATTHVPTSTPSHTPASPSATPTAHGKSGQHRHQATSPDPSEKAHPEDRGESSEGSEGKGAEVSALAKSTDATGVDKGAAISTLASDGRSKAGQSPHPKPSARPTPSPDEHSEGHSDGHTSGQGSTPPSTGRSDEKRPVDVPNKGAAAGSHRH